MLGARPVVPAATSRMKFLKENWAWIVVPILLFAAVVAVFVNSQSAAEDQNIYDVR
jgi:hypothetical protein